MNYTNLDNGLYINSQIPLNPKGIAFTLNQLKDLGLNNVMAFKYHAGLNVYCLEDNSIYAWKETTEENTEGLLDNNYQYPLNFETPFFNYSEKYFNFFKIGSSFTAEQVEQLLALIYTEGTVSLNVSITSFEKNLTDGTSVTFTWVVTANDDTINAATFEGSNIASNLNSNQVFTGVEDTIDKTLAVQFLSTFDNSTRNVVLSRTATALIPQWKGQKANNTTLNGSSYVALSGDFTKILQANSATSITVTAGNYGVFLSTNANATIIENGTGFALAPTAFIKNTITVEYENGTDLTLTEYIIQPATGTFSYTIN